MEKDRFRLSILQQKSDWWDSLTEDQLNEINRGIKDIKLGKTVSSKTVWQKYGRERITELD